MKRKYFMTKEENIFTVKRNIVDYIWKSARLEGLDISYSDADAVFYGDKAPSIRVYDIIAVNNLKHAWYYLLDNINTLVDVSYICTLNKIVGGNNLVNNAGHIRKTAVSIGGTSWKPDIPNENQIEQELSDVLSIKNETERAITLMLYLMRKQLFIDGNKRTSMLAGNQVMIANGCGIISIPIEHQQIFKELLVQFYESGNMDEIKMFVYENCIDGIDFRQQNERQRMEDIEKIIREVDASMTLEGLPLTDEDKERIRECLNDPSLFDKKIKELIEKHTVYNTDSLLKID